MPHTLVPSDRVEHVNVYGQDGAKLGTIERLMLDKAQRNCLRRDQDWRAAAATIIVRPVGRSFPRAGLSDRCTPEDLRAGPSELDGSLRLASHATSHTDRSMVEGVTGCDGSLARLR